MTSPNHTKINLGEILKHFSQQYIREYTHKYSHLPKVEHEDDWPSPCEVLSSNNDIDTRDINKYNMDNRDLSQNEVYWQPVNIAAEPGVNFDNVESALDLILHPDVKTYFTTLYSDNLDATCAEGDLSLLFAWNHDDFQRLQENIIGHILMKQRLKQTETIFFAVTDEEDMIISIDNHNGSVWVERVGCKPHTKLTDSVSAFIKQLTPRIT